jgi:Cu-Zn family superoxide dismutase
MLDYYAYNSAIAYIQGGPLAPTINGFIRFAPVIGGTEIYIEVSGLPHYQAATNNNNPIGPHGLHIHEFGNCEICDPNNPFQAAGGHWNPRNQPHGNHAGDLPVIFSNNGYARMSFFTNKFTVDEVIGKAIIIHNNPDDYRTQPAWDAGKRLACGTIESEHLNCCHSNYYNY